MHTTTAPSVTLPPPLAADLGKHARTDVSSGDSGSSVTRFDRANSSSVYLKTRSIDAGGNERRLFDEAERLGWMHAVGLAVPAVLQYHEWKGREYLLLTALGGTDASAARPASQHAAIVNALASGLRALHATNISACPFDQSRSSRVSAAHSRLQRGLVQEDDFDAERRGRTASDLYNELLASAPGTEDRTFTHGDFSLPNVILDDDGSGGLRVSGFVDCGNAGVADRYQDLALCARDVASAFGADLVPTLFARYGLDHVDAEKLAYYQLLDEFF